MIGPPLLLGLVALLAAAVVLFRRRDRALLIFVPIALLSYLFVSFLPLEKAPLPGAPQVVRPAAYVGSQSCQSCHPGEYETWHRSYHRSMTRSVKELAFDGKTSPSLPVELSDDERHYRIFRDRDGDVVVSGPDLGFQGAAFEKFRGDEEAHFRQVVRSAPRSERKLVLVTGSHHYLAFWVEGGEERGLRQLPFVYLLKERAWAQRSEVFLAPKGETLQIPVWNSSCIQCHTVAFAPRESEGKTPTPWVKYESEVSDLGIACEACHGPGAAHVAKFSSPLARFEARASEAPQEKPDLLLLSPKRLAAEERNALCGQCHAYFVPRLADEFWDSGYRKRAPAEKDYADGRVLLEANAPEKAEALGLSRDLESIFWSDGSVRVGGREYQGLLDSACFTRGTGKDRLSCTTCHQLHGGTLEGALPNNESPDQPCRNCHPGYADRKHTRHSAQSSGASCVSCHMPKTSYALLKGIRAHRITSPKVTSGGPPSACVLCHLDRGPSWLATELSRFTQRDVKTGDDSNEIPLGARLALAGDAGERALIASALGEPSVRQLVAKEYAWLLLRELENDPYRAVARIAAKSSLSMGAPPQTSPRPPWVDVVLKNRNNNPIVISE